MLTPRQRTTPPTARPTTLLIRRATATRPTPTSPRRTSPTRKTTPHTTTATSTPRTPTTSTPPKPTTPTPSPPRTTPTTPTVPTNPMHPTVEARTANRIYSLTITLQTHSRTKPIPKSAHTRPISSKIIPNQKNHQQQLMTLPNDPLNGRTLKKRTANHTLMMGWAIDTRPEKTSHWTRKVSSRTGHIQKWTVPLIGQPHGMHLKTGAQDGERDLITEKYQVLIGTTQI